ncbi:MAG: hypothetical protein AAGC60_29835 [Acidobacteriota bacterium]
MNEYCQIVGNATEDCGRAREALAHFENFELLYNVDQDVLEIDDEHIMASMAHVKSCDACSSWLKEHVDPSYVRRQKRMKKYCCAELFSAVEESEESDGSRLHPRHIRDEILWLVRVDPRSE